MAMTPRERALYLLVQRRAAGLSPDLAKALLDAYDRIKNALSPAEIERLIASGQIDRVIDDALLDRSLLPYRLELQRAVEKGFDANTQNLPRAGKIDGEVAVGFDKLNPRVIDAVRALDTRVVNTLKDEIRETVRAHIENGLRDGKNPRVIAKDLRAIIGLAPNQEEAVENYRRALMGENRNPLDYKLRDRRYDALLRRGEAMTPEQIDRAVEVYRRKMEAFHANTVSRTAAVDAQKLGQRLSWQDAIDKGTVDGGNLYRKWVTVGDDRVRPEHVAMNGEEVPFDQHYSNGEMVPGESAWNCRCVERYTVKRGSPVAAAA